MPNRCYGTNMDIDLTNNPLKGVSIDKEKIFEFLQQSSFLGIPNAVWLGGVIFFLISRSEHRPYDN